MAEFLKSLSPKTRILLALILGGIVIILFWITLFGFLSARRNMARVNQYNIAIGLARQTDADFQLAISKGKNFAILKDEPNKERTLGYFQKAKASFELLSQVERDPEGKELLYRLGAGLHNVEFPLGILTSTAKKNDPAEKLYGRYLKDITIDFDNASQAYVDYLAEQIKSTEESIASQTKMDLLFALIGAFLGLAGMGLSYSIAHSLNKALRNETASQERYRILSEVAEEALMIHDKGIVVEANPSLSRLLGYPLSEVLGQHVSRFMDQASAHVTEERIRKGYPEESYELTARRKDGSTFPLLVHGRDIEYQGRKMRLSFGWDLSEWKKAEKALQESEERFRRFAGVTKEGILIHEKGIIRDVNQALVEMTGFSAEEIIGNDSTSFLTEGSVALVQKFRREGYPTAPYEVTIRRKDGTLLPAEAHGRDFPSEGKILRVVRMWDITERKKAGKALEESEERFRKFAEVAKEGIFIHDEGVVVDANQSLAEMTGYPLSEIIGHKDVFFWEPKAKDLIEKYKKEGYPGHSYEVVIRRKDGSLFPAEVQGRDFQWSGKKLRVVTLWDITDRKKAEETLKNSEEKFRSLIENSHDMISITGKDAVVSYVSSSVKRILGYAPAELVGQRFAPIMHPDDIGRMRAIFAEFLKTKGTTVKAYFRLKHKNGTWRDIESVGVNLLESPPVDAIIYNMRDITERKQAEEALRRSEERFRAMLENSSEGITLAATDGSVLYISPSNKKLTGYEPEERLGRGIMEVLHPDDLPRARVLMEKLRQTPGTMFATQVRIRHKSGEWRDAEVIATNLINNPDVGGILFNSRDITDKKRAEEALRQSEEKFRGLIDNSHDVISVSGKDRSMTYISPSVTRVLGYEPAEMIGRGYAEIMHPDDIDRIKGEFSKLSGMSGASWTVRFRLKHKDGSWRYVESTGTNLLENRAVQGIVYNLRDVTERLAAEEDLKRSEENFRNLIEKSPDAILVNRDSRIIYGNLKLPILLGYDEMEEILGKPILAFVHPEDQKTVLQRIQTLSRGGRTSPIEMRLVRKDGASLPVETASISIQFEGGSAIMVSLRDITARKQAEAEVRETQERYRSLVESMPDAVMVHDEENILYVNPSAVKTFGAQSEEEFVGKPFWMVVPAEFRDPVRARLRATMEKGTVNELAERKLKRLDGTLIDVLVTSVPFYDRGRRVVLAIFLDVTARKQAEEENRKNQERFRRIFEDSPIGIGLVSLDSRIITANPKLCEIVGYGVEELTGKSFAEITHPEDVNLDLGYFQQLAKGEISTYNIEKRFIHKSGSLIWGDLTGTLIRDEKGTPIYGLGMVEDITGRKTAEQKAQKYQRLAALGEMAAGMAHEIRNPTAAISAQAQYLLKKLEGNGMAYEQLKDIIQQCDRLETLVHDTLDYSPEKKFEERTEIPARDLLQKALWLAQTQFGPSHARVKVILDVAPELSALRVHPSRMERVLVNLILNAFQAMPEGGLLLVEGKSLENKAIIRVQDDGKGITEPEMARLFEPFYTSRKMGSGLGLAICQKIVEEHQGKIRVERVEPHGAAFIIEIPFEQGKPS